MGKANDTISKEESRKLFDALIDSLKEIVEQQTHLKYESLDIEVDMSNKPKLGCFLIKLKIQIPYDIEVEEKDDDDDDDKHYEEPDTTFYSDRNSI